MAGLAKQEPSPSRCIEDITYTDYYWLKTELIDFCRAKNLPTFGSKEALTNRIICYFQLGHIADSDIKEKAQDYKKIPLSLDANIPINYKNDQRHRAFFKTLIGEHFKFNVQFMDWMKTNPGRTYGDAVQAWLEIDQAKRAGQKTTIAKQFEYNQYIRDFFNDQVGYTLEEAIRCWTYKKSLPGSNAYEKSDLQVL